MDSHTYLLSNLLIVYLSLKIKFLDNEHVQKIEIGICS